MRVAAAFSPHHSGGKNLSPTKRHTLHPMRPSRLTPRSSSSIRLHRVALAALLISFLSVTAAQTTNGSVTGSVRHDDSKAFLEGAEVTLKGHGGRFLVGRVPAVHDIRQALDLL